MLRRSSPRSTRPPAWDDHESSSYLILKCRFRAGRLSQSYTSPDTEVRNCCCNVLAWLGSRGRTLIIGGRQALAHADCLGGGQTAPLTGGPCSLYKKRRPDRLRGMEKPLRLVERVNDSAWVPWPRTFSSGNDQSAVTPARMSLRKRRAYLLSGRPLRVAGGGRKIKELKKVAAASYKAGSIKQVSEWIHPVCHQIQNCLSHGCSSVGLAAKLRAEARTGGHSEVPAV